MSFLGDITGSKSNNKQEKERNNVDQNKGNHKTLKKSISRSMTPRHNNKSNVSLENIKEEQNEIWEEIEKLSDQISSVQLLGIKEIKKEIVSDLNKFLNQIKDLKQSQKSLWQEIETLQKQKKETEKKERETRRRSKNNSLKIKNKFESIKQRQEKNEERLKKIEENLRKLESTKQKPNKVISQLAKEVGEKVEKKVKRDHLNKLKKIMETEVIDKIDNNKSDIETLKESIIRIQDNLENKKSFKDSDKLDTGNFKSSGSETDLDENKDNLSEKRQNKPKQEEKNKEQLDLSDLNQDEKTVLRALKDNQKIEKEKLATMLGVSKSDFKRLLKDLDNKLGKIKKE